MTAVLSVLRAGPLVTIQDEGRFGMLRHGVSASGPMDVGSFHQASLSGRGAIEFTTTGITFCVTNGNCTMAFAGGAFNIAIDGQSRDWPGRAQLQSGSVISVTPGSSGNYGYLRFDKDIAAELVMGSMATSSRVHLGGIAGRPLRAGDVVELDNLGTASLSKARKPSADGPFRFIWGVHIDMFAAATRQSFLSSSFTISSRMDRMGVRLNDSEKVFAAATNLFLASEAIVPGDLQIMGDGTPIVLMRDHQPTGGYPRIATIISADLDRFAQTRPGTSIAFTPVTVERAQQSLRSLL